MHGHLFSTRCTVIRIKVGCELSFHVNLIDKFYKMIYAHCRKMDTKEKLIIPSKPIIVR